MVTFSDTPYREAWSKGNRQEKIIAELLKDDAGNEPDLNLAMSRLSED
jgi:hypothetical protein